MRLFFILLIACAILKIDSGHALYPSNDRYEVNESSRLIQYSTDQKRHLRTYDAGEERGFFNGLSKFCFGSPS
ncbi:secreted RxLR effector peptide protein, putative [Phytophthora infestans T30-4]|uniref:Secreted RxLR effector peptide protein, putative n=1 Tax=Phytophthora infestans (strain T30-4) TaxID=403677 RepID=D0N8C9_PHYIT|nr:secreted RxLR effector peptide protein, putative [Phytophthora infestans T30-4]EEY53814.1 secreted RxLR effector peptide protein, putative [Phytophthora infestans T30-4]|eukprot:XP_002904445.1 secreted RxLR effector peptide protein, putative [Phytophthora infestans T30-4]